MTREYALIGLVVGIIIGAVAMRFGNRKLRQQQALQYELEKNKAELEEYREELVSHFARSAELLDNMAHDYRQLYQHMAKSSNNLLPDSMADANPFRNRLEESEASNDQAPVQMPRDYSEGASGLLRGGANAIKPAAIKIFSGAPVAPAPSPLPGYNLNQSPRCYLCKNSITSGYSGHFSIHLRLREPASNEETDFAVECVSVKHWVIVVGPASGSGILTDSGARPGRVTKPGADAGKGSAGGG